MAEEDIKVEILEPDFELIEEQSGPITRKRRRKQVSPQKYDIENDEVLAKNAKVEEDDFFVGILPSVKTEKPSLLKLAPKLDKLKMKTRGQSPKQLSPNQNTVPKSTTGWTILTPISNSNGQIVYKTVQTNKLHRCTKCSFVFSTQAEVDHHMKTYHICWTCSKCNLVLKVSSFYTGKLGHRISFPKVTCSS